MSTVWERKNKDIREISRVPKREISRVPKFPVCPYSFVPKQVPKLLIILVFVYFPLTSLVRTQLLCRWNIVQAIHWKGSLPDHFLPASSFGQTSGFDSNSGRQSLSIIICLAVYKLMKMIPMEVSFARFIPCLSFIALQICSLYVQLWNHHWNLSHCTLPIAYFHIGPHWIGVMHLHWING